MRRTAGDKLRDHGHTQTEAHADPRVIAAIDAAIDRANASGEPWSANDIRDALPTSHRPCVGSRVRAAAMRKEMVQTGRFPKSNLPSTRSARVAEWIGVTAKVAAA